MSGTAASRRAYRLKAEAETAEGLVGIGPALCVCGAELPLRTLRTGQRTAWFCSDECREIVIWAVVYALAGESSQMGLGRLYAAHTKP